MQVVVSVRMRLVFLGERTEDYERARERERDRERPFATYLKVGTPRPHWKMEHP